MYNLSVETAHTFYVGEGQWLVHNAGCVYFPSGKKQVDGSTIDTGEALKLADKFLGQGYKQIADGVFVSKVGTRMGRMTDSDLAATGNHAGAPHMNFAG
jgi:hypothetical protein